MLQQHKLLLYGIILGISHLLYDTEPRIVWLMSLALITGIL